MTLSDIELPSNRKFGLFFTAVFAIAVGYFFYEGASGLAWVFFALAIVFFVVTLTKSELLLPLNKCWMRFGLLLGMIVSPIVMGVIFFALFTPIGFLMRLFGRDELRLKPKSHASYWKVRNPIRPSVDSFKHQF